MNDNSYLSDKSKETLFELIGGTVGLTIVELVVFMLLELSINISWINNVGTIFLGSILGGLAATLLVCDMYKSLGKALTCGEAEAEKIVRQRAMLRMAVIITIIFLSVCFFSRQINVVMLLLGIINLKFAVYIQPFTNKCFYKMYKRKVRKC